MLAATGQDIHLGINEDTLSEFAIDISNYSEEVMELFSSIDSKMNELKAYFDGSEYENIMKSYREFRKNYSVVKNTILSYSDDLICVINKVRAGDKQIANLFDQMSEDVSNEAKKIRNEF